LDALVPAFIAALLAGIADRPARLAALLGTGSGVWAGFAIGTALAIALSVAGGIVVAPLLASNARSLILGIALVAAGAGALWMRAVRVQRGPRPFAAATGGFVLGDGTGFLAFALAVKGSAPVLAGVGAFAGAMTLVSAAATLGPGWGRLPLRTLGRVAGALLIVTGLIVALGALRLV